jgi:hypothetical protein
MPAWCPKGTAASEPAQLRFVVHNPWQNNLGETTRVTAAFVCVDDEHTILYPRFCHRRRSELKKEAQAPAA